MFETIYQTVSVKQDNDTCISIVQIIVITSLMVSYPRYKILALRYQFSITTRGLRSMIE